MYLIEHFKGNQWHNIDFDYKIENEKQAKELFQKIKDNIENGNNPNNMEIIRLCQIIDSYIYAPQPEVPEFDIPMPNYDEFEKLPEGVIPSGEFSCPEMIARTPSYRQIMEKIIREEDVLYGYTKSNSEMKVQLDYLEKKLSTMSETEFYAYITNENWSHFQDEYLLDESYQEWLKDYDTEPDKQILSDMILVEDFAEDFKFLSNEEKRDKLEELETTWKYDWDYVFGELYVGLELETKKKAYFDKVENFMDKLREKCFTH